MRGQSAVTVRPVLRRRCSQTTDREALLWWDKTKGTDEGAEEEYSTCTESVGTQERELHQDRVLSFVILLLSLSVRALFYMWFSFLKTFGRMIVVLINGD